MGFNKQLARHLALTFLVFSGSAVGQLPQLGTTILDASGLPVDVANSNANQTGESNPTFGASPNTTTQTVSAAGFSQREINIGSTTYVQTIVEPVESSATFDPSTGFTPPVQSLEPLVLTQMEYGSFSDPRISTSMAPFPPTLNAFDPAREQPLLTPSLDQKVNAGANVDIDVYSNVVMSAYPLTIPFSVSSTDGVVVSPGAGEVVFESGRKASVTLAISPEGSGERSFQVEFGDPSTTEVKWSGRRVVTVNVTDENLPPMVDLSVQQFLPGPFSHLQLEDRGCASCHQGRDAQGKPPNHIPTTSRCDACHSTDDWLFASFDHSQAYGVCSNCHNSSTAIIGPRPPPKPADHVITDFPCGACHLPDSWTPAAFDHSFVPGSATCASCHNWSSTPLPPTHPAITQDCGECHVVEGWAVLDQAPTTDTTPPGDERVVDLGWYGQRLNNTDTVAIAMATASGSAPFRYNWSASDNNLVPLRNTDGSLFRYNAAGVVAGTYLLKLTVTDANGQNNSVELPIVVGHEFAVLTDTSDADGDGVVDIAEGASDNDGDGMPNYLDAVSESWLLNSKDLGGTLQTHPDLKMRLGDVALQTGEYDAVVSSVAAAELGRDELATAPGKLINVNIASLAFAGQSVPLVVPLQPNYTPILRKIDGTTWAPITDNDGISVTGTVQDVASGASCPMPGSSVYDAGTPLTDSNCVQITIQDGGALDEDGTANGVVKVLLAFQWMEGGDDTIPSGSANQNSNGDASSDGGGGSPYGLFALLGLMLTVRRLQVNFSRKTGAESATSTKS